MECWANTDQPISRFYSINTIKLTKRILSFKYYWKKNRNNSKRLVGWSQSRVQLVSFHMILAIQRQTLRRKTWKKRKGHTIKWKRHDHTQVLKLIELFFCCVNTDTWKVIFICEQPKWILEWTQNRLFHQIYWILRIWWSNPVHHILNWSNDIQFKFSKICICSSSKMLPTILLFTVHAFISPASKLNCVLYFPIDCCR